MNRRVEAAEAKVAAVAKERDEARADVDRLTGLLGHIREHILTDENFDADELASDIAGSVNLSEYDRLTKRADAASRQLAEARAALGPFVAAFAKRKATYDNRGPDAPKWFEAMPGHWPTDLSVTMDDCRKARALLAGETT